MYLLSHGYIFQLNFFSVLIPDAIYSQLFAQEDDNISSVITNSILVHMGLLKASIIYCILPSIPFEGSVVA